MSQRLGRNCETISALERVCSTLLPRKLDPRYGQEICGDLEQGFKSRDRALGSTPVHDAYGWLYGSHLPDGRGRSSCTRWTGGSDQQVAE